MTKHSVLSAKIDNASDCLWVCLDHNSRCNRQLQLHFPAEFADFCNSLISVKGWGFGWVWFSFYQMHWFYLHHEELKSSSLVFLLNIFNIKSNYYVLHVNNNFFIWHLFYFAWVWYCVGYFGGVFLIFFLPFKKVNSVMFKCQTTRDSYYLFHNF